MTATFYEKPLTINRYIHIAIVILAIFSFSLFIASLYHRIITNDDAFFAELAYWFARDGYVHSELFEGVPVFTGHILMYQKLHVWEGALVYKLFGWNAYYFKAIALPYLAVFLGLVFYFTKYLDLSVSRTNTFIIFLFLLFANHQAVEQGFEYRPEIPMMCIGFLSYIFLHHALNRSNMRYPILAGLMAGITALFHLNGLIFIAAGGLLLLYHRQYKMSILFGIGAIIGFIPYFYQMTSLPAIHHYLYELTHDPAVSQKDRTLSGMLFKLLTEYRRFTHHIYEFIYLIIFIFTLVFNWRRITRNTESKNLFLYTLFLTIFMALITTGSKTMYLLYSIPYVLLLIAVYSPYALSHKKATILFLSLIMIYFLVNLDRIHGIMFDKKNYSPKLFADITNKYHINKGSYIFAPDKFIFNEIGKVHIQCYWAYTAKFHYDYSKITIPNVLGDIYNRHKSFAILTPGMLRQLKLTPRKNNVYAGYKYIGKEKNLYIFKRIPDLHISV